MCSTVKRPPSSSIPCAAGRRCTRGDSTGRPRCGTPHASRQCKGRRQSTDVGNLPTHSLHSHQNSVLSHPKASLRVTDSAGIVKGAAGPAAPRACAGRAAPRCHRGLHGTNDRTRESGTVFRPAGGRRRDRHFADAPSPPLLIHLLLKVEGGAALVSLALLCLPFGAVCGLTTWPHTAKPAWPFVRSKDSHGPRRSRSSKPSLA